MRQWNGATPREADSDARAELARELERSRRYDRAFALVRVHAHGSGGTSGTAERAIRELESSLRTIDRVWTSGGDFVYLLPECDRAHANGFVKRLADAAGTELSTTIACFPEDGLTGGLLIELVLGDVDALADGQPATMNGNGTRSAARRHLWASVPDFLRRRNAAQAAQAIEWTEVSPMPPQSEPVDDASPVVSEAERALR